MNNINQLPIETVKLISSAQIVTSISAVVKELVENSLDAGASNIQVKLDNFGLNLIEVRDDGPGVDYGNVQKMFLAGCTSKIRNFNDLSALHSYGFRGEALSAICRLGETTVTTKTEEDTLAMTYTIDRNGVSTASKPSHLIKGTTISIHRIFNNLPVRKQYASSKKKMAEELKKVEAIVHSLSVIHPTLRMTLVHNKSNIWQKNSVNSLKQSFMQVVGLRLASRMEYLKEEHDEITLDLLVPKKDLKEFDGIFVTSSINTFVHINKRPVYFKEISKVVSECIFQHFRDIGEKHVLNLVSITLPPDDIDLNLEPNKTKVLLKNLDKVLSLLREVMCKYYETSVVTQQVSKFKVSECYGVGSVEQRNRDENILMKMAKEEVVSVQVPENVSERSWCLTVINEDHERTPEPPHPKPCHITPVCSQINRTNCNLTTEKEVKQLNDVLATSWGTNLARILDTAGRKLPQRPALLDSRQITPEKHLQNKSADRPRLPDWPVRQKTPIKTQEITLPGPEIVTPLPLAEASRDGNPSLFSYSVSSYPTSNEERPALPDWPIHQATPSENIAPPILAQDGAFRHSVSAYQSSTICDESRKDENASDKISEAQWSRGQVGLSSGKVLEGGSAVVRSRLMNEDVEMFDLSQQSVSSQMGKKELSGFTKYARIMRPKITSEQPGLIFTEVSKRLVDGWRNLSTDEKDYYNDVAKVVDEERKTHRLQPKNCTVVSKRKNEKEIQGPASKKVHFKRPERISVTVNASFQEIVDAYKQKKRTESDDHDVMRLIGQLNEAKGWLYYKNGEIGHIRHSGLEEMVLYHKMMNSHEVAKRKLENVVILSNEGMGISWKILLSLPTVYDETTCKNVVVCDAITKNGFRLEFVPADIPTSAVITELAADIENFGVTELKEILHLLDWHGEVAGLSKLRPKSVEKYILSEVLRIVQNNAMPPNEQDMKALLDSWQLCLKHLPAKCLHQNDIFVPIYPAVVSQN